LKVDAQPKKGEKLQEREREMRYPRGPPKQLERGNGYPYKMVGGGRRRLKIVPKGAQTIEIKRNQVKKGAGRYIGLIETKKRKGPLKAVRTSYGPGKGTIGVEIPESVSEDERVYNFLSLELRV